MVQKVDGHISWQKYVDGIADLSFYRQDKTIETDFKSLTDKTFDGIISSRNFLDGIADLSF